MNLKPCFLFLAASVLAACSPDVSGPVKMAVLQWDPDTNGYGLEVVEVRTLEDLPSLRGEAATPIVGASIVLDGRLNYVSTEKQFRDAVLDDPGTAAKAQFLEKDGVYWPSDFQSLSLASAYYGFERARAYALARGVDPEALRGVPVYYFPSFRVNRDDRGKDNAAWYSSLRSFLLFRFEELQSIPLAMNQGVIAHEYGHGIFTAEVHGGAWNPDYVDRWCPVSCVDTAGPIMLSLLEEGFADVWAVATTGDPRFIGHSLLEWEGRGRDLNYFDPKAHCWSQREFDEEIGYFARYFAGSREKAEHWGPRKYELGTVWASALYGASKAPNTDLDRVVDALRASYRSIGPRSLAAVVAEDPTGDSFGRLDTIASAIIAGAPDDATRVALCAVFQDRLSLTADALGAACSGVPSNGQCR